MGGTVRDISVDGRDVLEHGSPGHPHFQIASGSSFLKGYIAGGRAQRADLIEKRPSQP
jgi:hypothetical protein